MPDLGMLCIIGLFIAGYAFMIIEMFVPGGIMGIIAFFRTL